MFRFSNGLAQTNIVLNSYHGESSVQASQSITLSDGFHVPNGSNFTASIVYSPLQICRPIQDYVVSNRNYVQNFAPMVPGIKSLSDIYTKNTCEVASSISFFDGLGRQLQNIKVAASENGYDIVRAFEYDENGREKIKYLPYADINGGIGDYKEFALNKNHGAMKFYNPPGTSGSQQSSGIIRTPNPYSETVFEPSPLNRTIEQGFPGADWQIQSGHTNKVAYDFNEPNEVKLWTVNGSACISNGFFTENELFKTVTKDENWIEGKGGTQEEFKDKSGRTVLKKVWLDETNAASTYYLYDDFENLRYVLPPGVTGNAFEEGDSQFNAYIYAYHYDKKQRLTEKKIPGKGWEEMVYNAVNQLVLKRDAKQKLNNKWNFFKYDVMGRDILSGLLSSSDSRTAWQNRLDTDSQHPLWESRDNLNANNSETGYTANSLPAQNDLNATYTIDRYLNIKYYDDYLFHGSTVSTGTHTSRTRGLLTGERTNILNSATMLLTTVYFDEKGNPIKKTEQNHLGGSDVSELSYAFTGSVTSSYKTHTAGNNLTTISNTYSYDRLGRKTSVAQNINQKGWVIVSKYDYNDIGQLKTKFIHSVDNGTTFLQKTDYSYNERGWLRSSNADKFKQTLNYVPSELQNGAQANYNGNISQQIYFGDHSGQRSFNYSYDKLNRLENSVYSNGSLLNEKLSYDIMGNILSLERGTSGNPIIYQYEENNKSNKLSNVSGGLSGGFVYDTNGNLIEDGTKNGTAYLTYNDLNLPSTVTGSTSATYTYDAGGKKLHSAQGNFERDYINEINYQNGILSFIITEEGKAVRIGTTDDYRYEYNLKDHLGNIRVSIDDQGNNTARVIQENEYYAFGMVKPGGYLFGDKNNYLYNGKELLEVLGEFDYGARFYNPVIGRFNVVDRFAEKYDPLTPYSYTANNPINFLDHNGDYIIITGADSQGHQYSVMYENGNAYHYSKNKDGSLTRGGKYDGKNDFIENTVADLNEIGSSKYGKSLIGDLQDSKETVDIKFLAGEQQSYDDKRNSIGYNQGNGGVHDGVAFNKSFIKLGHELSHAWDDLIGRSDLMHTNIGGTKWTERNAVRFENYLRAMSGETNMRMNYGDNALGFGSSNPGYFKNYSFPLRKNEIYKRITTSNSVLQDNTRVDQNIQWRYDTRLQKFTSGYIK